MPETVVHDLEVVEVDEQHRDLTGLGALVERAAQAVDEEHPVRQARQWVVDGLVREPLAAGAPLRDVLDLTHRVQRLALRVADERYRHRHPDRTAVAVDEALLEAIPRDLAVEQPAHRFLRRLAVGGMGQRHHRRARELVVSAPEHARERAVDTEVPAFERRERHADRCVVECAAEPLLRLAELRLCAFALGDIATRQHDALDRRVVEHVRRHRLQRHPAAALVGHAELGPPGIAVDADARREQRGELLAIIRVDPRQRVRTHEACAAPAERAVRGRAEVGDGAVGTDDRDDVARFAEE